MPLKNYGVLKGRAVDKRLGTNANAHYQVHLIDDDTDYRIAINVQSKLSPSELEHLVVEQFDHPMLAELPDLKVGFTDLERKPGGMAMDFIRGNLFDPKAMKPLPFNVPGPNNDLNEKLDHYISQAMGDETATLYAFGERWGPEGGKKDKIFGFLPGNGIHDIHMNQGNAGQFTKDDGVYQDGALLIHFPERNQWVGIFLKFQSQTWHTDDQTGHRIDTVPGGSGPGAQPETPGHPPTPPQENAGRVRIIAALVNPKGPEPEAETVTLLNASPQAVDLSGWAIADRQKHKQPLSGSLAAGATLAVPLADALNLGNEGGIITLLDNQGLKVAGVSYSRGQAEREGWTVVF